MEKIAATCGLRDFDKVDTVLDCLGLPELLSEFKHCTGNVRPLVFARLAKLYSAYHWNEPIDEYAGWGQKYDEFLSVRDKLIAEGDMAKLKAFLLSWKSENHERIMLHKLYCVVHNCTWEKP
jgi:hypothetical protein